MARSTGTTSVLSLLIAALVPALVDSSSSQEASALRELFVSAGGANWTRSSGWRNVSAPPCDWFGVACNSAGGVIGVSLPANGLRGSIAPSLGSIETLETIQLQENFLTGRIPSSLGRLSGLRVLELWENAISGSIPEELCSLGSLASLGIAKNVLEGTLPRCMGHMPSLTGLQCFQNRLSGELPPGIGNNTRFNNLFVNDNRFSGTIPEELYSSRGLTMIDFRSNHFSGTISTRIGQLTNAEMLLFGINWFSGTLPTTLGNLEKASKLIFLSNNLRGVIPTQIGRLSNLVDLSWAKNGISGVIPTQICRLTRVVGLNFYDNNMSGSVPSCLGAMTQLKELQMSVNHFSGRLPSSLGKLSLLNMLDVSQNELSGQLPEELSGCVSLQVLNLVQNHFTGGSMAFASMPVLTEIDISNNPWQESMTYFIASLWARTQLEYCSIEVPGAPQASNCLSLEVLRISNTTISGSIPVSIFWLHAFSLDFSGNERLVGTLPDTFGTQDFEHLTKLKSRVISELLNPTSLNIIRMQDLPNVHGDIPPSWTVIANVGDTAIMNLSRTGLKSRDGRIPHWVVASGLVPVADRALVRCPLLTNTQGSMVLGIDPDYYDWDGCSCEPGTYGQRGVCIAPCPDGSTCQTGVVHSLSGYWCTTPDVGQSALCFPCPVGFCGPCEDEGCHQTTQCSKSNRQGILCGECQPGLTPAIGTERCLEPSECAAAAAWAVPLAVVVAGFGTLLLFAFGEFKAGRAVEEAEHEEIVSVSTVVDMNSCLLHFYQIVPMVAGPLIEKSLGLFGNVVLGIFNVAPQRSGAQDSFGICIPGFTQAAVSASGLLLPLTLVFWTFTIGGAGWALRWRCPGTLRRVVTKRSFPFVAFSTCFLSYTTTMKTAFRLVRCVEIDGELRLWSAPDVQCFQTWQVLTIVFLAVPLVLGPGALWLWARREYRRQRQELERSMRTGKTSTAAHVVFDQAASAYKQDKYFWAASLLLERLVFVSIFSLVIWPRARSLCLYLGVILADQWFRYCDPHRHALCSRFDSFLRVALIALAGAGMTHQWVQAEDPNGDTQWSLAVTAGILAVLPGLVVFGAFVFVVGSKARVAVSRISSRPKSLEMDVLTHGTQ